MDNLQLKEITRSGLCLWSIAQHDELENNIGHGRPFLLEHEPLDPAIALRAEKKGVEDCRVIFEALSWPDRSALTKQSGELDQHIQENEIGCWWTEECNNYCAIDARSTLSFRPILELVRYENFCLSSMSTYLSSW
ncbi:hypothetical protein, variant [Verruconis gallopava]|uniref:Uncharacterized protein n=1 Tax=Verruconis gallopava TaxID=253628 RepID=A0A0D2AHQ1_9PEZI|nr:hypothetical protein, variant [Verruconis gallopava]KIW06423.1 hypothetical protein, variant [Verruconis gallopava]